MYISEILQPIHPPPPPTPTTVYSMVAPLHRPIKELIFYSGTSRLVTDGIKDGFSYTGLQAKSISFILVPVDLQGSFLRGELSLPLSARVHSRYKTLNQYWLKVGRRRWTNVEPILIQLLVSAPQACL